MDIYEILNPKITSITKVQAETTASQCIHYNTLLNYNELIYVKKGEAKVVFDGTVIMNKPGDVIFLPIGKCSNYYAQILSNEECVDIFFCADLPMPPKPINQNFLNNAKLPSLFEKIYQIWSRKEPGYYNKCMSLFYSILSEIELSASTYLPQNKKDKLNGAINYIHSHYTDSDFQYEHLPSLCGISYTYFKKLFIECFHVTPSEYVRNLKFKLACELLLTNKFSVSQVAQACGFHDLCHFSKFFKNHAGVSPSRWK